MKPEAEQARAQGAEETEKQLIDSAREVFDERGYRSATVEAITERAGYAHGTFYLYFANKEDAMVRVLDVSMHEFLDLATEQGDGGDFPGGPLHLGALTMMDRVGLWRAILEAILVSDRVKQVWAQLRGMFVEFVAADLRDRQAAGEIAADLDTASASYALTAMIEWTAFCHLGIGQPGPDEISTDRLLDTAETLWRRSLKADPPPPADE